MAVVVVVSSIRCGFKIVQRQVNETIIIIIVVVVLLLLLLLLLIHEVHVVILQIIIRTGVVTTASSSIVGVGDCVDFYHNICYIYEAKQA